MFKAFPLVEFVTSYVSAATTFTTERNRCVRYTQERINRKKTSLLPTMIYIGPPDHEAVAATKAADMFTNQCMYAQYI